MCLGFDNFDLYVHYLAIYYVGIENRSFVFCTYIINSRSLPVPTNL